MATCDRCHLLLLHISIKKRGIYQQKYARGYSHWHRKRWTRHMVDDSHSLMNRAKQAPSENYTNLNTGGAKFHLCLPYPHPPSDSRAAEVEKILSFLGLCLILHGEYSPPGSLLFQPCWSQGLTCGNGCFLTALHKLFRSC